MPDRYGIPEGGNDGAYSAKYWMNLSHQLTWREMIATVALGGWPERLWAEAAATAAAESSRKPFIYNTYKLGHFGLFQISRSAHPKFFDPNGNGMLWVNPPSNSKEGYRIYREQGWGAWEAHSKGGHLAFMAQAKAAVSAVKRGGTGQQYWVSLYSETTKKLVTLAMLGHDSGKAIGEAIMPGIEAGAAGIAEGVVDSGAAVADTVGDMATVVTDLWEAITTPALWMRLGYGVLGIGLVAGGLFLIVRNTPAGTAATKVARPVGRALKSVKASA